MSLALSPSLCLSLSLFLSHSVCLCKSPLLCVDLSISFFLTLYLSVSPSLSLFFFTATHGIYFTPSRVNSRDDEYKSQISSFSNTETSLQPYHVHTDHIFFTLMFNVNIKQSSWPASAWLYALSRCFIGGWLSTVFTVTYKRTLLYNSKVVLRLTMNWTVRFLEKG